MARNELAEWTMRRRRQLDLSSGRRGRREGSGDIEDGMAGEERGGKGEEGEGEGGFLPEPIDDAWKCEKCYAVEACMLYRKVCFSNFL